MNRRLVGGIASVLLGLIGTFVLLNYVRSAEDRALEGKELVQVILIDGQRAVSAGTPADRIPLRVAQVPSEIVAANAVSDALELLDMVAAVDLIPGEQLIWDRLIDATEYAEAEEARVGPTDLPPGYMEITVPIPADRALGGRIEIGETIALIGIFNGAADPTVFDPNDAIEGAVTNEDTLAYVEPPPDQSTHMLARGVLVTGIQVDELPIEVENPVGDDEDGEEAEEPRDEGPKVTQAPSGIYLLSLALRTYDVERVVFAQEYGSMWIARDPVGTDYSGSQVQSLESIYDQIDIPLAEGAGTATGGTATGGTAIGGSSTNGASSLTELLTESE